MKNLIIIPAGDNSLHINWNISKNIDLCIIYYGNNEKIESIYKKTSKYYYNLKGAKWELIYKILYKNNIDFTKYNNIWFPDDDLDLNDKNMIDDMFNIMDKYELFLAQPSLLDNGNITKNYKNILKHDDNQAIIKYTNFVEIMCPIMSNRCFKLLKHTLLDSNLKCGWGLDDVWPHIILENKFINKIGIINDCIIIHTRPLNKPNEGFYSKLDIDPFKEMKITLNKYNVKRIKKCIINCI